MDTETTGESSSTTSHSGGTSGSDDVSGIDAAMGNPRGGWGQQVNSGNPLVGKLLKTLTVTTRLSSNIGGRSDKDMTVKVFAGTTSTIRGTSEAISTSTLTTAGTWYDKTFTFTNSVQISAGDCICVCIDGDVGTSGGWNAKIKGSPESTNQGYWVTFQDATNPTGGSVQTNRSMIYTATYYTAVGKCTNDASTTSDLDSYTNLPVNTIFEQTDDTPTYWWKQSDNTWRLDGTAEKSSSGGTVSLTSGGSNVMATISLGSTASNTWMLRFSTVFTDYDANSYWNACLSSSDGNTATAQNYLGCLFRKDGSQNFGVHDVSDGSAPNSVNSSPQQAFTNNSSSTYYWEIIRQGATSCKVNFYGTDSTYGTVTSSSEDTSVANATGLDRIKFMSDASTNNTGSITIGNVKFQNGTTEWLE
jgi:hypothetical protein